VFAFTVASGLELYLAKELDKNKPRPLLSSSILRLAVNPLLFDENNDQAAILKLLLDCGADLKTICYKQGLSVYVCMSLSSIY
jgi:hypothetical protein